MSPRDYDELKLQVEKFATLEEARAARLATTVDDSRKNKTRDERRDNRKEEPKRYESGPSKPDTCRDDYRGSGKRSRRAYQPYEPLITNTLFTLPQGEILERIKDKTPAFRWPKPLGGDPKDRRSTNHCAFHKDFGPKTDNCYSLKFHLEELARKGELEQYIKGRDRNPERCAT